MKNTHAESAATVKDPERTLMDQTGTCLQHGLRLCSGEGQAGISPSATSKATRKPASRVRSSLRSNVFFQSKNRMMGGGKEMAMTCIHNNRCRYTHGFYCDDCKTFFSKDSPTYRSDELLTAIWYVLNNINANSKQNGGPEIADAMAMRNKIGIGKRHDDYEALIAEAEAVMARYGVTSDSASVTIR